MLNFLKLDQEDSFGLEVSNSFIKIAYLERKRKGFSFASWGELEIPEGLFFNGEVKNEKELATKIKEALSKVKGKKIKTKNVVSCLPETSAFFQTIKMPKIDNEEELKSAVFFEAENHIPFSVDEVELDFEVVSEENSQVDNILLAALPKKNVSLYVACLKKAGLSPRAIEVEPYSLIRSLVKDEKSKNPILIVDFGKYSTLFVIFFNKEIKFTSTSQISFYALSQAISEKLNISYEEAKKIEKENDLKTKEIIESFILELTDEVKKYIDYYQARSNSKKIEKIILSGKRANLKELSEYISEATKIPTKAGNPWVNISNFSDKNNIISFEKSLELSTALGLALRKI